VFFIEAIATTSLKFVVNTGFVGHLVWFIILYPTFIAIAFFVILWTKREVLYSPADFREDIVPSFSSKAPTTGAIVGPSPDWL